MKVKIFNWLGRPQDIKIFENECDIRNQRIKKQQDRSMEKEFATLSAKPVTLMGGHPEGSTPHSKILCARRYISKEVYLIRTKMVRYHLGVTKTHSFPTKLNSFHLLLRHIPLFSTALH